MSEYLLAKKLSEFSLGGGKSSTFHETAKGPVREAGVSVPNGADLHGPQGQCTNCLTKFCLGYYEKKSQ